MNSALHWKKQGSVSEIGKGRVLNDAIRTLKYHQGKYDAKVGNLRKLPKQ